MSDEPLPSRVEDWIPAAKLTDYLLSASHAVGQSKARFFLGEGYAANNPDALARDLMRVAQDGEVIDSQETPLGQKYTVEGIVISPSGNELLRLRCVWVVEAGHDRPSFVTAYPA